MTRFTIPGKPPGLNEYIAAERSGRCGAAKLKRDAGQKIRLAAKAQLRGQRWKRRF